MAIKLQKLAPAVLLAGVSVALLALPKQGWAKDPQVNNTIIVKKHKRFQHRNSPYGYGPSHYGRGYPYNNPRSGFRRRPNRYGYGDNYPRRRPPNYYSDPIPRGYPPHRPEFGYDSRYQNPLPNAAPHVERRGFGLGGNYRNR